MRKLTPEQMTELENTPWDQKPRCVWNSFDYVQAAEADEWNREYIDSMTTEELADKKRQLEIFKTFGD